MKTLKSVICDWFKFMLSIPRAKPMTMTQKFTMWSSLIFYCAGGFILLAWVQLWKIIFRIDFQGRTEGYIRLALLGVFILGFQIVIMARSSDQSPRNGTILGTIFGRLVYVNGVLLMMIVRDMVPLSFALTFIILDSSLALITLVIWVRETEGASVILFFQEVSLPILKLRGVTSGYSMAAVFFIGITTMFFWLVFTIRPDTAQNIFHLDQFQGHSGGFLACVFFTLSLHGWCHVTNTSCVNHPFVSGAIFYRIALSAPVLLVLYLVDQIERNLFIVLLSFDIGLSIVVYLFAVFSKREVMSPAVNNEPTQGTMLDSNWNTAKSVVFENTKLMKANERWWTTCLLVWTWRHEGHVQDAKNKSLSLLWELNIYFHVKFSAKSSVVLSSNMAALSLGYKPRVLAKHGSENHPRQSK